MSKKNDRARESLDQALERSRRYRAENPVRPAKIDGWGLGLPDLSRKVDQRFEQQEDESWGEWQSRVWAMLLLRALLLIVTLITCMSISVIWRMVQVNYDWPAYVGLIAMFISVACVAPFFLIVDRGIKSIFARGE